MINRLIELKAAIKQNKPLVHCITNPISINDCANVVLALGGKPIMAEHPREVAEITARAGALSVNLGNITDARLESMMIAGMEAKKRDIPCIIDLVGVSCSTLRLEFAKEFLKKAKPRVIKGNMSEMRAIAGASSHGIGIDVGDCDAVSEENLMDYVTLAKALSQKYHGVILATGKTDLVVNEDGAVRVDNGVEMLAQLTGTGCMLTVMVATAMACGTPWDGAVLATILLGIAGEKAHTPRGTGSFHTGLLDGLYTLSPTEFIQQAKVQIL